MPNLLILNLAQEIDYGDMALAMGVGIKAEMPRP